MGGVSTDICCEVNTRLFSSLCLTSGKKSSPSWHSALTSTPPCARRLYDALTSPDLCRATVASYPPASTWDLFSGLLPPPPAPPPLGPTHCRCQPGTRGQAEDWGCG